MKTFAKILIVLIPLVAMAFISMKVKQMKWHHKKNTFFNRVGHSKSKLGKMAKHASKQISRATKNNKGVKHWVNAGKKVVHA